MRVNEVVEYIDLFEQISGVGKTFEWKDRLTAPARERTDSSAAASFVTLSDDGEGEVDTSASAAYDSNTDDGVADADTNADANPGPEAAKLTPHVMCFRLHKGNPYGRYPVGIEQCWQ